MLKDRESIERGGGSPCSSLGGQSGPDLSPCAGCGGRIHDRYYLLAVDRQWHAACLKCCECNLPLDGELTCFARDGSIYCKDDYYRMFAVTRCGRCQAGISSNELVMRARDLVYHLHCFSCISCGIPLSKGDHFGMRDGLIFCSFCFNRPHPYDILDACDSSSSDQLDHTPYRSGGGDSSPGYYPPGGTPPHQGKGRPRKRRPPAGDGSPCGGDIPVAMRMAAATLEILQQGDLSSSMESLSYDSSVTSPASSNGHPGGAQRTKRMRTSFKHHQLRTMKTYFAINQNPDAKDLKQLAQKTGLSKRVLQVWFQNARAKWRRNLMRQEGSQGQNPNGLTNQNSSGIVDASSRVVDDLHHLHAAQAQSLAFADIY